MAEELQTLMVRLDANIEQFRRAMRESGKITETTTQKIERQLKKVSASFKRLGRDMMGIGTRMSAAITAPVALLGGSFIKAASDAEELQSAFNVTFGAMADEMNAWAVSVGDAMGRSTQEMQQGANTFGIFFNQAAKTREEAAKMSQTFAVLAQDLASFYNTDPQTAIDKLRSGLSGEAEPLRDFGVFLNEANVKAKALEMGLVGVGGELTEQQKILARYQIILEKTTAAQGDVARTSGSTANRLRELRADYTELSVEIGEKLLPITNRLLEIFSKAISAISSLSPEAQALGIALAGLAAAIGPIVLALGAMTVAIGALLTPLGAVVAGLTVLVTTGLWFRDELVAAFKAVADFIRNSWVGVVIDAIVWVRDRILEVVETLVESMAKLFEFMGADNMAKGLRAGIQSVKDFAVQTKEFMVDAFEAPGRAVDSLVSRVKASMAQMSGAINSSMGVNTGGSDGISEINVTAKAKEMPKALEDTKNKIKELKVQSVDFTSTLSRGFADVVTGAQSLGGVLNGLINQLANTALNSLFGSLLGGGAGGLFGGLFGKAGGGRISGPTLVGERGPELVVPQRPMTVMNAHDTRGAMGGPNVTVHQTIRFDVGLESVDTRIRQAAPQIMTAAQQGTMQALRRPRFA